MKFDISKLYYGMMLGFKLSRLEFIWGSPLEEAIRVFEESKSEIERMAYAENIKLDDTDFGTFISSILNHYMANDIESFYSVLIGSCFQRSILVGASSNPQNNAEMERLAKSSLQAIPEKVIGDKDHFFSFIRKQCAGNFDFPTTIQNIHRYLSELSSKYSDNYQIFISYRRDGGDIFAGRFADRLRTIGYHVFNDVETMRAGAFDEQIVNAISQCNDFLLILTPHALDRCINDDDWIRQELSLAYQLGKNIIPIMTWGFEYPKNLPEDIEKIRYTESVEYSSTYFDAVIQRLEQLLVSAQ